jgi:predicted AlkP superfamily pyrophosphatase or phosphodiesterase
MRLLPIGGLLVLALGCSDAPDRFAPISAVTTTAGAAALSTIDGNSEASLSLAIPNTPATSFRRALLVSIDGLRPDLALRGEMPRLRSLRQRGSYTFWAETSPEPYTLPCHVTMLTGVSAEKHGVTWNEYIEDSYPAVPTLFEKAKQSQRTTAVVVGKMKFIALTKPGAVDHAYIPPDEPVSDDEVATHAVRILRVHRPDVMFVHLPGVDTVGHEYGWGSPQQMAAIAKADLALGMLFDGLEELDLSGATVVLVTADHGGGEKSHEPNDPRSHFIPWIVAGPGIQPDSDLTRQVEGRVRIEDTFATICELLKIDSGPDGDGKSLASILLAPSNSSP